MGRATGEQRRRATREGRRVKTKVVVTGQNKRGHGGTRTTYYSYDGGKTWSKNKSQAGGTRKWTNPEKGPTQPTITTREQDKKALEAGKEERGNPGVKGGDADYGQGKDGKVVGQSSPGTQLKIKKKTNENNESNNDKVKVKKKKMHSIEKKNREIHGDTAINTLKQKHAEWKVARKNGTLDAWRKKWKKK